MEIAKRRARRCSIVYIGSSDRIRLADSERRAPSDERKEKTEGRADTDRSIARVRRYDIIVTNTESILYYCTSIFVIINPYRVTR